MTKTADLLFFFYRDKAVEEERENIAGRAGVFWKIKKKRTVSGSQRMHVCLWTRTNLRARITASYLSRKKRVNLSWFSSLFLFFRWNWLCSLNLIKNRLNPHHNVPDTLSCLHFIHLQSAKQHLDWQTSQALSWDHWLHAVNLIWQRTSSSVHSDRPASCLSPFPTGLTCWMLPATWTEFNTLLS